MTVTLVAVAAALFIACEHLYGKCNEQIVVLRGTNSFLSRSLSLRAIYFQIKRMKPRSIWEEIKWKEIISYLRTNTIHIVHPSYSVHVV